MFDVSPDHAIGLLAGLVAAPVALVVLPRQPGWTKVAGTLRGAAVLLLVTGAIHLALIPPHLQTEPLTSSLFAVNGVLFLALALRVSWRRWRVAAAALLTATILGYLVYLVAGLEGPGQLRLAAKLIALPPLGPGTMHSPGQ